MKKVNLYESENNIMVGFETDDGYIIESVYSKSSKCCSYREIARRMGVGRNTIAKYRNGNPMELSMYGIRQSKLDPFYDFIVQCLKSGWSKSRIVKAIYEKGYAGSKSNAFDYLVKIEEKINKRFVPQPYIRTMTEGSKYKTGSCGKDKDYVTREGVFRYMWMNTELTKEHKGYILNQYPHVFELHNCIREFRRIFEERKVPLLYLFIEKYCKSEINALRSFANGLKRDMDEWHMIITMVLWREQTVA